MNLPRTIIAITVTIVMSFGCAPQTAVPTIEETLQSALESAVAEAGFEKGCAVHVDSPKLGIDWASAVGAADPTTGEMMTPEHPVRIASNTKTYVATAVLGFWEDGRIDLDAPIGDLLPTEFVTILESDGYRPQDMTVRHLLTHTSGLYDHGAAESYADEIMAHPQKRWTRREQLQLCVDAGDPLGEPGTVYSYSDTGYILLGQILETINDSNLAEAVWTQIDRDALGLHATWFETLEDRPTGAHARAHQFFDETDVSGFDPSFDLWGGGGIAATVGDMARFFRALFDGAVYDNPETLETMLTTFDGLKAAPGASDRALPPGAYRMGLWVLDDDGLTLYRHSGFWCTAVTWIPELDVVLSMTANQHQAGELFDSLQDEMIDLLQEHAAHGQS